MSEKLKLAVEKTVLLHKLISNNKGESDEADKIRDELDECLKDLPEEKEWLKRLSASLDDFSKEISSSELHDAAEEWVFEKNKWSNNNDEAGDNFGSFLAGANWVLARKSKDE